MIVKLVVVVALDLMKTKIVMLMRLVAIPSMITMFQMVNEESFAAV